MGTFRGPSTSGAQDRSTRKHKQWLWLPKAKHGGCVLCAVANQLCVWSSAGFATARPASTRCALPLLRTTVRSRSQAVVSGAAVWLWGLVQDWTRVPRQQRDTLLGSRWPWGCAKVVSANMSELWPLPPSTEKSHLQWGKKQPAKENRAKDAGRGRPDGAV